LHAQIVDKNGFYAAERSIAALAEQVSEIQFNDALLDSLNGCLLDSLHQMLSRPESFDYDFDSLKYISKLRSNDKLLRIFTWNIAKSDGTYHHFGFLQYNLKDKKEVLLYSLIDNSDSIADPENQTLNDQNWFGATYYQIIETQTKSDTYYTLLGWDGNNLYTNKKVIDLLYFNSSGKPRFGKNIFKAGRTKSKRIIFEYSRMASMMIRWDDDLKMIVFDHLAPASSIYQGNPMFYGPDLSYDAFEFIDDVWVYLPTIDYKKQKPKKKFFR
jgi:hypothetical protein